MATVGRLLSPARSPGYAWSGGYKVEGQTLEDGEQVRRRVVLFPNNAITPIREVFSAADGSYLFEQLASGKYIVLGIDKTGNRNAVVYSHIDSVAM